jgi:hypothetical protein
MGPARGKLPNVLGPPGPRRQVKLEGRAAAEHGELYIFRELFSSVPSTVGDWCRQHRRLCPTKQIENYQSYIPCHVNKKPPLLRMCAVGEGKEQPPPAFESGNRLVGRRGLKMGRLLGLKLWHSLTDQCYHLRFELLCTQANAHHHHT